MKNKQQKKVVKALKNQLKVLKARKRVVDKKLEDTNNAILIGTHLASLNGDGQSRHILIDMMMGKKEK